MSFNRQKNNNLNCVNCANNSKQFNVAKTDFNDLKNNLPKDDGPNVCNENVVETSDCDSSDKSCDAESTIYTSEEESDSECADITNGIRGCKIENDVKRTASKDGEPTVTNASIIHSANNAPVQNNQIDIIQQIFKGDNSVQSFGDIQVENSKRVHIGNITYVTGPIHIVQTDGGSVGTLNQTVTANKSFTTTVDDTKSTNNSFKSTKSPSSTTVVAPPHTIKKSFADEHETEREESNAPGAFIGDFARAIDGRVLKIVNRRKWLAQPPLEETDILELPVPYVIISHTATEMTVTQAETVFMVRNIQTYHIESSNWFDIAYNFLIGCDGNVYEGRGWNRVGAHTAGYNKQAIGISFVGCFINCLPPDISMDACKLLIKKGIELGHISPDFKLLAHCQCSPTESPGRRFFQELKTWPHWSPVP